MNIVNVFFGSVRRAQWTLGGLFLLWAAMNYDIVADWANGLLNALLPLGVMAFGFLFLWKAVSKPKCPPPKKRS